MNILQNNIYDLRILYPAYESDKKLKILLKWLEQVGVYSVWLFNSSFDGDPAILHNLGSVNVAPGSWNSNTFPFTTGGTVSGGVSLLIEVVCGGAASCNGVVYIDNVTFN